MKIDVAISSLPVIKYNIQYYSGNNKEWQQALENVSEQVITTFPEIDIDLTRYREMQDKLDDLGIHDLDELDSLIDEYNEMKEKLEEIESLF